MPTINSERLMSDLSALRKIGACGTGVIRPAFSKNDMSARQWLKERFADANLIPTIDGVGNVLGRSKCEGKAMLLGSHLDTQPTGGWLDGALGVIYGLEVARSLAEDPSTEHLAVDVIAWQDEESRFYGCLGSRSFCDLLPPNIFDDLVDKDGYSLQQALQDAGISESPKLKVDLERYRGFLEAHIEQGPHLEEEELKIGIVNSIVGLRGMVFSFTGKQNHAGTTMMSSRKDASTALYALAHSINEEFPKIAGPRSVWTMGRAIINPGAASIIPGHAELELQYRDPSTQVLNNFDMVVQDTVQKINDIGGAEVEAKMSRVQIPPAAMDEILQSHLLNSAEQHAPEKWRKMPSGAFHDAGVLSEVMPCAMLFIPSIDGVSHDFSENSHVSDIILGCQVLGDATASILSNK